ncbi:MAG: PhzF family phenazine biosynthesis protein [Congregibacter sp.]
MSAKPFDQVDVFAGEQFRGNPVAVVHEADDLSDQQMLDFARWTNLSETTFVLRPTLSEADYRLRIFTPGGELPFAGHPTLGSCHAWMRRSNRISETRDTSEEIFQECPLGIVSIRRDGDLLAFKAPPLLRSGPLDDELVEELAKALSVPLASIKGHQWVDNGPGWCALLLDSAERVRALTPDLYALGDYSLGIVGPGLASEECDFEVRAFVPSLGVPEDPVTGSLNAGLAQWLMGAGIANSHYIAHQGTAINRAGRIELRKAGDAIWVGGATRTCIAGEVRF